MKLNIECIETIVNVSGNNSFSHLVFEYGIYTSPFGTVCIATADERIISIKFVDNAMSLFADFLKEWPGATLHQYDKKLQYIFDQLFIETTEVLPVLLNGTSFQIRVWKALLEIPYGETTTYQDIATAVGNPSASRAVGNAVGANSIAYLIPCHRVVRSDGEIGIYRWGSDKKAAMLAFETP